MSEQPGTLVTNEANRMAITRLEQLIRKGRLAASAIRESSEDARIHYVDSHLFYQWQTQCLTFLTNFLGEKHIYTRNFHERVDSARQSLTMIGVGILEGVLEDLQHGYLSHWAELVHANTFADFLEMADYLLKDGGYKDAAAVMAGGTLEAHLRNLCEKHGIDTYRTTRDGSLPKKADALNADLAREEVYSKLDQKSVTAWLDLRNNAAHGHYDAYNSDQVAFMTQGIRDFITRLPA